MLVQYKAQALAIAHNAFLGEKVDVLTYQAWGALSQPRRHLIAKGSSEVHADPLLLGHTGPKAPCRCSGIVEHGRMLEVSGVGIAHQGGGPILATPVQTAKCYPVGDVEQVRIDAKGMSCITTGEQKPMVVALFLPAPHDSHGVNQRIAANFESEVPVRDAQAGLGADQHAVEVVRSCGSAFHRGRQRARILIEHQGIHQALSAQVPGGRITVLVRGQDKLCLGRACAIKSQSAIGHRADFPLDDDG